MAIITSESLEEKYKKFKKGMGAFDSRIEARVVRMAAGPVASDLMKNIYKSLGMERDYLNAFKLTPGLAQFAKDYEGDQSYDVLAEIDAVVTATESAITEFDVRVPKDDGYAKVETWSNGAVIPRNFGVTATAPIRTALTAITDIIG